MYRDYSLSQREKHGIKKEHGFWSHIKLNEKLFCHIGTLRPTTSHPSFHFFNSIVAEEMGSQMCPCND